MPSHPRNLHSEFTYAFNRGDLEALVAMYEPNATLVVEPGKEVTGTDAIRAALAEFLALKGVMKMESGHSVVSGEIAITRGKWSLKGTTPEGVPVEMSSGNLEVVRRGADGKWRIVIDDPYGNA